MAKDSLRGYSVSGKILPRGGRLFCVQIINDNLPEPVYDKIIDLLPPPPPLQPQKLTDNLHHNGMEAEIMLQG